MAAGGTAAGGTELLWRAAAGASGRHGGGDGSRGCPEPGRRAGRWPLPAAVPAAAAAGAGGVAVLGAAGCGWEGGSGRGATAPVWVTGCTAGGGVAGAVRGITCCGGGMEAARAAGAGSGGAPSARGRAGWSNSIRAPCPPPVTGAAATGGTWGADGRLAGASGIRGWPGPAGPALASQGAGCTPHAPRAGAPPPGVSEAPGASGMVVCGTDCCGGTVVRTGRPATCPGPARGVGDADSAHRPGCAPWLP